MNFISLQLPREDIIRLIGRRLLKIAPGVGIVISIALSEIIDTIDEKGLKGLLYLSASMQHLAIHAQSALRHIRLFRTSCNDDFIINLSKSNCALHLQTLEFVLSGEMTDKSRKAWPRFTALLNLKLGGDSTQQTGKSIKYLAKMTQLQALEVPSVTAFETPDNLRILLGNGVGLCSLQRLSWKPTYKSLSIDFGEVITEILRNWSQTQRDNMTKLRFPGPFSFAHFLHLTEIHKLCPNLEHTIFGTVPIEICDNLAQFAPHLRKLDISQCNLPSFTRCFTSLQSLSDLEWLKLDLVLPANSEFPDLSSLFGLKHLTVVGVKPVALPEAHIPNSLEHFRIPQWTWHPTKLHNISLGTLITSKEDLGSILTNLWNVRRLEVKLNQETSIYHRNLEDLQLKTDSPAFIVLPQLRKLSLSTSAELEHVLPKLAPELSELELKLESGVSFSFSSLIPFAGTLASLSISSQDTMRLSKRYFKKLSLLQSVTLSGPKLSLSRRFCATLSALPLLTALKLHLCSVENFEWLQIPFLMDLELVQVNSSGAALSLNVDGSSSSCKLPLLRNIALEHVTVESIALQGLKHLDFVTLDSCSIPGHFSIIRCPSFALLSLEKINLHDFELRELPKLDWISVIATSFPDSPERFRCDETTCPALTSFYYSSSNLEADADIIERFRQLAPKSLTHFDTLEL